MPARPPALLAAIAILVAACGGSTATAEPKPTEVVAATEAPIPMEVTFPTDGALPSFDLSSFHADAQLEDLLPDEIGGAPLFALSISGDEFMATGGSAELDAALGALGKSASDLSVAFGGTGAAVIFAFRVDGVPGDLILNALFAAYQEEAGVAIENVSIGGKAVRNLVAATAGETTHVYTARDVVFTVGGTDDPAVLAEIFQKLP